MKNVELFKLLIVTPITSGYLSKLEILIIFVLSITSCYVVKIEMLLAENKLLSSSSTLIEEAVIQRYIGNVKKSIIMLEKALNQTPDNLWFKVELTLSYFMEENYTKPKMVAVQALNEKNFPEIVNNNMINFIALTEPTD